MSKYIDVHSHLAAKDFDEDLSDIIHEAKQSGVAVGLVVTETFEEFQKCLNLAEKFPDYVAPCLGIHPIQGEPPDEQRSVSLTDFTDEVFQFIEDHSEKLVAIGEVGLDFTPRFCKTDQNKEEQRLILAKQVELAKKLDLPVNIHSRSAGRPTIALLKETGASKVLLHAFDGRPSVAMEGVAAGYYFSIPPSIIRSEQKQKLVSNIPLENLLLETDSPALGPQKQVRNVPSNISVSCEYVAKIKNVDIETVRKITTENALKLFPKVSRFFK